MSLLRRCFLWLVLPAFVLAQQAHPPSGHRLLVICIAGLDARFLALPPARLKIPNIRKLMRDGATAVDVVGVAPSDNASSMTSLTTGTPPAQHGDSIEHAASLEGLQVAAVNWPGIAAADVAFDFPPAPEVPGQRDTQFESVAAHATPAGVIDSIEKAHPGFEKQLWDDTSSVRAATWLLENRKADVVLVALTDIDSLQRETGALSIYARDALETDDDLIGQMLTAAGGGSTVAIVSGHGFENENYIVRPRVLLKQGSTKADVSKVEVKDGLIGTVDPVVATRLRQLMNDGHRHGLAREVPMSEVKSKDPSLAKWIAAFDTSPNSVASAEDNGPALGPGSHHGVSGFWPTRPGYRSIFVVAGNGIHAQKFVEIDLLQIAPTLAGAIGIKLPQARKGSLWPTISR